MHPAQWGWQDPVSGEVKPGPSLSNAVKVFEQRVSGVRLLLFFFLDIYTEGPNQSLLFFFLICILLDESTVFGQLVHELLSEPTEAKADDRQIDFAMGRNVR